MKWTPIAILFLASCLAAQVPSSPEPSRLPPNLESLVTEGIVTAPIAEIWRVFSTAQGHTKLGVAKTEMDFRPGGLIRTTNDASQSPDGEAGIQTEIIAYEPLRMIATRIHRPPKGFPFTEAWRNVWTVVSLADLGEARTLVRVAMMGYGPDAESRAMREFFRTSNDWVLRKLQSQYGTTAAPTGSAHAEAPLAPIDVETVVAADRETVWRTFATSQGWKSFFGVQADIGSQPGEPFEVFFNPEARQGERGSEGCRILSLIPNELLSYTWNAPPESPFVRGLRTWIVVTFETLSPTTTRVRLRHLGFAELAARHADHRAEIESVRAYFANAGPQVLSALTAYFTAAPAALPDR
ncbi:MAG: SRPBCC family protein [Acidobacteriota bacterium]